MSERKRFTFLTKYKEQMVNAMSELYPTLDRGVIEQVVMKKMKENLKNPILNFNGEKISMLDFLDFIEHEKPIITGYGALYKNHYEADNILANMADFLMKERKVYKKKMLEHVNDADQSVHDMYDTMQKNIKILNNSFYGASIEKNSIFFNPLFGPSITYSGEDIITTAVIAFETFISNNIEFRSLNDVVRYIQNIKKETYTTCDNNAELIEQRVDESELFNYIISKSVCEINDKYIKRIERIIGTLTDEEIQKVYFKNNFFEFIDRSSNVVIDMYDNVMGRFDFLDPNEPPKDLIVELDKIWLYLTEWVFYNYSDFHRLDRCKNGKRQSVLTIDTDSNFLYLKPYFDFFQNKFPERVDDSNDESIISTINVSTYHLTKLINATYMKFTGDLNVPEEFGPRINMKNEFLLKRILMTRNKKNYAGVILMQEGTILNPPKLDLKGLAIRKVSTNIHVREYFTKLLRDDILNAKELKIASIFKKFRDLEITIRQSLLSGSLDFATPGKVNEIESYKDPYTIMSLRGTLLWNKLFPDKEITLPNKVNLIKLNISSLEQLQDLDPHTYGLIEELFENERLVKNGLNVIAIPKTEESIPEWITKFIDVDTMVSDNIKPGIIMLESLGFKTLDILNQQLPTNVIEI